MPEASETLAGASVRKKLLAERAYMFEHDSEGRQTYIGRDAKSLVSIALGKSERHIRFLSDLPPGSYDLVLNLGNVDDRTQQCILTAIVAKAFDLDIKKTDVTEDALVLKQSADTVLKMQPTFDMASPSSVQQSGYAGFLFKPKRASYRGHNRREIWRNGCRGYCVVRTLRWSDSLAGDKRGVR